MRKTYSVSGQEEMTIPVFISGGIAHYVKLTGGRRTGNIPASYTTAVKAMQDAIERSPFYTRGIIKISNIEYDQPVEAVEEKKEEPSNESKQYPEVHNSQLAKAVLMNEYNVSMKELGSKTDILKKASELNVIFPNWN